MQLYEVRISFELVKIVRTTHPNSSFGGKGTISLTHLDYLNDSKRLSRRGKSDMFSWNQGIDLAIFAICCHAATLLPRSGTPFCKGIPKDPWQRGSKITKNNFFFSINRSGPSLMAPLLFNNPGLFGNTLGVIFISFGEILFSSEENDFLSAVSFYT